MNHFLNRKRKQTMPQKIDRSRGAAAAASHNKRRRTTTTTTSELSSFLDQFDDSNPLQDHEVGSLKGDFNWTTIFDDFTSIDNNLLNEGGASVSSSSSSSCATSTGGHVSRASNNNSPGSSSLVQSPSPLNDSASSFFNLAFPNHRVQFHAASLEHQPEAAAAATAAAAAALVTGNNENLNIFSDSFGSGSVSSSATYDNVGSSLTHDKMEKLLSADSLFHSISDLDHGGANDDVIMDDVGSISIDEFFQSGLDLTVQGHQITAPAHWAPVGTDLETILCESQESSNLSNSPSNSSSPGASR